MTTLRTQVRRKPADTAQLGKRLAPHVAAVARGRIVAAPVEPKPVQEAQTGARDDVVRQTIRRRWRSERPFEGMTSEAIARKLRAGALTHEARDHAIAELTRRGQKP